MKKQRNISIELIRILAMFMIVLGHAIIHGHAAENIQSSMYKNLVMAIQTFTVPGTDVFVIISGYFLLNSKISIKRSLILWLQILFYSVSLYLFASVVGGAGFSFLGLVKAFLPISFNQYWFMRVYFYLIMCAPFLNILLNSLQQKAHKYLIFLGIILMVIPASIPGIAQFNSDSGNGILWFVMLYSTGAYLSKYPLKFRMTRYFMMACCLFLFAFISRVGISWFSTLLGFEGMGESRFSTFDAFPIYAGACCLVCTGIKMKVKIRQESFIGKGILFLAGSTAGVYMIHEHPLIRNILWQRVALEDHRILYTIFISILIFVICACIDQLTWKNILKCLDKINIEKANDLFISIFKN